MNIRQVNPYIRHAAPSLLTPPLHINRRILLDYELLYVESGSFSFIYNDIPFTCQAGDLLLICPNIPHSFHILNQPVSQPHIHFDLCYDSWSERVYICYQDRPSLPASHIPMIRENILPTRSNTPFLKIPDMGAFLEIFYRVIHGEDPNSLSSRADMLRLLEKIFQSYPPAVTEAPIPENNTASLIKSYIDANYSQAITLDALENLFGYSKFYIERLFHRIYGQSVIRYQNERRMEAAPSLLLRHSATTVAQMLGYSSVYVFSRAFRRHYGLCPTAYRDSLKK